MYNWSVDEEKFKNADPAGYEVWKIQQMINYGLGDEKLEEREVRKHWTKLRLDPLKKKYLMFLLWPSGKAF